LFVQDNDEPVWRQLVEHCQEWEIQQHAEVALAELQAAVQLPQAVLAPTAAANATDGRGAPNSLAAIVLALVVLFCAAVCAWQQMMRSD
jgi:hypothetical protein